MKFFKCDKCGNVVISVNEKSDDIKCCDASMRLLKPGEVDGAVEKHVPDFARFDETINVKIGEVDHPMEEDHYIEFVAYEYDDDFDVVRLKPGEQPRAYFVDKGPGVLYEFCNKHGLWKKDVE
jgi:superoxide reductase